jgi:hypothetical protein
LLARVRMHDPAVEASRGKDIQDRVMVAQVPELSHKRRIFRSRWS